MGMVDDETITSVPADTLPMRFLQRRELRGMWHPQGR
jgi:hypothetical protein